MWREVYRLGVDQLDEQRKHLFLVVEDLLSAVKQEAPDYKQRGKTAIEFFENYVVVHFRTEEMHMENYAYSNAEEHISAHRAFAETVREFKFELIRKDYDIEVLRRMAAVMTNWCMYHVMREDRRVMEEAAGSADLLQVEEEFLD